MKRRLWCLALAITAGASLFAADGKEPWQWTDEERVAARMDRAAAAERLRVVTESGEFSVSGEGAASIGDVIGGRRNPHLLLTWEVFDRLTVSAFMMDAPLRDSYRRFMDRHRRELSLPDDFWMRLEAIAAPVLADQRQPYSEALVELVCRDRFAALTEARREFGPAFDRFLYEAIAPAGMMALNATFDADAALRTSHGCP